MNEGRYPVLNVTIVRARAGQVKTTAPSAFREATACPGPRSPLTVRVGTTASLVRLTQCGVSQSVSCLPSVRRRMFRGYPRRDPSRPVHPSPKHQTGISEPEPCPLGTYGNTTGLRKISDCTDCDPGYYCDQRGLTGPAGLCDPGYFCLDGSYTSAPSAPGSPLSADESDIGGLCLGGCRIVLVV